MSLNDDPKKRSRVESSDDEDEPLFKKKVNSVTAVSRPVHIVKPLIRERSVVKSNHITHSKPSIRDIDVTQYDEKELRELNRKISERLVTLTILKVRNYSVGARVQFTTTKTREHVIGTVEKLNTKSVTVRTDAGRQWRVSPGMLSTVNE